MGLKQASILSSSYRHLRDSDKEYDRTADWLRFFGTIADRIISDINPETVLDAGCGLGLLVESLRRRGVEAYGVDPSNRVVRSIHPEIRPYCWAGSIAEPFPREYDLIVSLEAVGRLSRSRAELVIVNLCEHSEDILFSASPVHDRDIVDFNVQPLEYWAMLFARQGFFRDVDFDAFFIAPWALRLRKMPGVLPRIVANYERRIWHVLQEITAVRESDLAHRQELADSERVIQELEGRIEQLERRWDGLEDSLGWKAMLMLQKMRAFVAPPHSVRDQAIEGVLRGIRNRDEQALRRTSILVADDISRRFRQFWWTLRLRLTPLQGEAIKVPSITNRPLARPHSNSVDIVVCVHNALNDVQSCLESIHAHTNQPYSLILVDDGSAAETRDYLARYARTHGATLVRHDEAQGYTRAANQGLRHSTAAFVLLLNSDTIVTENWLDRLVACAESDPQIGLVGPLSNTASWQSIPEVEDCGDWATNPLPIGMTIDQMGALVARYSARLYPPMPLLNGFCMLIKRDVIDSIGYFDEETFKGYGEEDDYVLRARQAGWHAALADDVYIYHAQSRSYSDARRHTLVRESGKRLVNKHGPYKIAEAVTFCRRNRVLEGIRARNQASLVRRKLVEGGHEQFGGRRVLFILPITEPGGGANVIIDEAIAMREMGVDARIFNRTDFQDSFEQAYPNLSIPVVYGSPENLRSISSGYDAVVASVYFTVEWLRPLAASHCSPVLGYYVQGFEPYIYKPGTAKYQQALDSYTLIPSLRLFTKTRWTRGEVQKYTNVEPSLVGASVNIDIFRPRPPQEPDWLERPLAVAAMIRSSTPYREPALTMEILRQASRAWPGRIQPVIFGTDMEDAAFGELPLDFAWLSAGVLNRRQVAWLFNEIDVFVDFSSHQAMGLTALEAMACGAAVVVPECGGATAFARHEENSLVADTTSRQASWEALQRLIEDDDLRQQLQLAAIKDVAMLLPERSAFRILKVLFGEWE